MVSVPSPSSKEVVQPKKSSVFQCLILPRAITQLSYCWVLSSQLLLPVKRATSTTSLQGCMDLNLISASNISTVTSVLDDSWLLWAKRMMAVERYDLICWHSYRPATSSKLMLQSNWQSGKSTTTHRHSGHLQCFLCKVSVTKCVYGLCPCTISKYVGVLKKVKFWENR